MDPDANLTEQLRILARLRAAFDRGEPFDRYAVARLAELVEALDGWMKAGGFLPRRWEAKR